MTLRERNKRRKEEAIRSAARALFEEHGFDATTLREVALRADVGFGTVFAYAQDKVGLLAMVYVAELKSLSALFDYRSKHAEPLDELAAAMAKLFEFWAKIPKLSNRVLEHIEFYADSPHMDKIQERRREAREEITAWVRALQVAGRLDPSFPATDAGATFFAIYTSVVREWSGTAPEQPQLGVEQFRRLARLPLAALLAGASATGSSGRPPIVSGTTPPRDALEEGKG